MKILIVDDSATSRTYLKAVFAKSGHEIMEARSGIEAIYFFKNHKFDLITMDIIMPGIDGYETCRRIREYENSVKKNSKNYIPLVFVTNNDTLEGRIKGFESGGTDFITKPSTESEIHDVIDRIFNKKSNFSGISSLIVEEDKNLSDIISNIIQNEGGKVINFDSIKESFDFMRNNPDKVDIVLTSYSLNDGKGDDFCSKIRNNLGLKNIPVIFLIKNEELDKVLNIFKLGGTDYIMKPFAKEQFIARINSHLESLHLNKTLEHQVNELKKLNKVKDNFLAICSHDIKSPMTGIIGCADLMYESDCDNDKHKTMLKQISVSGKFLLELINDLLDVAKMQFEQPLDFQELFMDKIVEEAIESSKTIAENKEIDINYKNSAGKRLNILGNKNALLRAINNLLSNAVKFTNLHGEINIEIDKLEDELITVKISDTGIGIPEDKIKSIFDKYSKTSRQGTGGEKGTGLGLSITKDIIEKHQGKIEVESKVNEGTTFIITIPLV
jgi:two-component system, sensor histidine kinase and response regulator